MSTKGPIQMRPGAGPHQLHGKKAEKIKDFKGTVILVSHEPEFYQDIVTDIWNLEDWTTKIV